MALHSTIQQRMDEAAARWKWLRLLEYSAMLGIIVTGVVLLLGAVLACGRPANKSVAALCLVLFSVGAVLTLVLWSLIIATSRPEQGRLARAIERAHPILMDRLNTLVFLRRQKDTPCVRSFYRRVEAQASSALAGRSPGRLFSPTRAVIRFCVLVAMVLLTILFYLQFTPLAAPATASLPKK